MKPILTAFLIALGGAAHAGDVTGVWQTAPAENGARLHIAIAPCGDAVCGTIKTAFDGDKKIVSDYEHLGKTMINGMIAKSDTDWASGTIWAPDQDKTYRAKMKLVSDSQLKVSGCVAGGLICRSQDWFRVGGG